MGSITIAQINTAVVETLGTAQGVTFTQDADELTEGMQDVPTLQVYWENLTSDARADNADRSTFSKGVIVTRLTFHADVLVRPRAHIGEDMAATIALASAVNDVLEAQTQKPYFGLAGIQAFTYTAERVTFDYGKVSYAGTRFILTLTVF